MNQWQAIRQLARKKRAEIDPLAKLEKADDLLAAAASETQILCEGLAADDPLLYGAEAVLDTYVHRIWYNREIDPAWLAVYKAHEYAHCWIEGGKSACSTLEFESRLAEEKSPLGIDRVESYSPKERREALANVFAREFLLPTDWLRARFIQDHWLASTIAAHVGVPENLVFHQLTDALLLPTDEGTVSLKKTPTISVGLDEYQEHAATISKGPLLVNAGPGTGKTRTLVGRIEYLNLPAKCASRVDTDTNLFEQGRGGDARALGTGFTRCRRIRLDGYFPCFRI